MEKMLCAAADMAMGMHDANAWTNNWTIWPYCISMRI